MSNRRAALIAAAMVPALAAALLAQGCSASPRVLGHPPGPLAHRRPATLYIYASLAGSGANVLTPVNTATNTSGTPIHVGEPGGPSYPGGTIVITPNGKTAYITRWANSVPHATNAVIPISTATGTPGTPIPAAGEGLPVIAVTPDGKTAYVSTETGCQRRTRTCTLTVTPVSTSTTTPGRPIRLADRHAGFGQIVVTPDGTTAYITTGQGVTPISTATGTPGRLIHVGQSSFIAVTPDGKTVYVTESGSPAHPTATVTPISTVTNTPGRTIDVGGAGFVQGIAVTPDGKTAYVSTGAGCQASSSCPLTVTPISAATNTPGTPIHLGVAPQGCTGQAGQIAITPDGKSVYVITGLGVTPISTAANTPGKPIKVGASPPDSCRQIVITPDGKTAYVTTGSGVTPISTATNTPGKPIKVGALGTYAEAIAIAP